MFSAQACIQHIIPKTTADFSREGSAFAPVNIALIKYWGKRDIELNLPVTDSLSIGLRTLGTRTRIRWTEGEDSISLNGELLPSDNAFVSRTRQYLNYFRPNPSLGFIIDTYNDVPTGAGLASSASGYAALVLALNDLCQWQLNKTHLSILARIGSGSASRSLWDGLVHWHAGTQADGMDSYATPIAHQLPSLRVGLLTLSRKTKPISSRLGMQQTVHGLSLYPAWKPMVEQHLSQLQTAIAAQDIAQIGEISEHNALSMHATMLSASPALCYFLPETIATLQTLWQARSEGLACWATLDAGPNVKLLFDVNEEAAVKACFPEVSIVQPFG